MQVLNTYKVFLVFKEKVESLFVIFIVSLQRKMLNQGFSPLTFFINLYTVVNTEVKWRGMTLIFIKTFSHVKTKVVENKQVLASVLYQCSCLDEQTGLFHIVI